MARTLATATEAERRAAAEKARKNNPEATDDTRLFQALRKLGATVGPINDSTRALYQRRLDKLMKKKGVAHLDQILENEEEETVIQKPKNTRRGRQRKNTEESEEEAKSSLEINKEDKKAPIEKTKNKRNGRRPATIVEDEEAEEPVPIQNQIEDVAKANHRKSERKTKDKKVSFARTAIGGVELSDAEEGEIHVKQLVKKKREPSVDVIVIEEKDDKQRGQKAKKMDDKRRINGTIVIEDESGESEEERRETRAVNETEEEDDVERNDENNQSDDDEDKGKEDYHEIREEDEANSSVASLEEEEENDDNGGEMKNGSEIDYEEKNEREEGLTPTRPMMIRHVLTVDTPKEVERVRRMEMDHEEDEIDRRMTNELFNTRSQRSHRSTMNIFRGKTSRESTENGAQEMFQLPHTNTSKILEESENMDISNGFEDGASKVNLLNHMKLVDDSEDMEISNTPQNGSVNTLNLIAQVDPIIQQGNNRTLIGETPKRSKREREDGVGGMRRKGRDGERSREEQRGRWNESEEKWTRPDISPSIHGPFRRSTHRGYLDDSVGMDTFYEGVGTRKSSRMHSTPNLDVVDGEKETSNEAGKTFVVRTKRTKTPPRLTRNLLRSPSPTRNRRGTYVIPQPSLIPAKSSLVLLHSPYRSRAPPKPMPRRIINNPVSMVDSSMAPSSSIAVAPPVPAPRRRIRDTKGEDVKESRLGRSEEVKMAESREGEMEEISPASRFLTQPRPRQKREDAKEVFTPVDRENIEKLRSLRERMKELRRVGHPIGKVELEARMIVEDSPYLKRFFY